MLAGHDDVGLWVEQRVDIREHLGRRAVALGVGPQGADEVFSRHVSRFADWRSLEQFVNGLRPHAQESREVTVSLKKALVDLGGVEVSERDVSDRGGHVDGSAGGNGDGAAFGCERGARMLDAI